MNIFQSLHGLKFFVVLFFVLILAIPSNATHIIGGEITYDCLGDGRYKMFITIYRDCDNGIAPFDDPAILGVFDEGTYQAEFDLLLGRIDTLTPIVADSCLIPPNICVETSTYELEILLPEPVVGFNFVYFECCRNNDIVNIINDEQTGSIFLTYLSDDNYVACQNSVKFKDWPPLAICVDEPINWDHSIDPTTMTAGNEIRYKLCSPLNFTFPLFEIDTTPILDNVTNAEIFDRFDTVRYEVGFSESRMLNGTPDISIDSLSGLISGVPEQKGRYVIGVCVEEYDIFDSLVSYVRRDFQYNVVDCDNTLARFDLDSVYCFYEGESFILSPFNRTTATTSFSWSITGPDGTLTSTLRNPSFQLQDTGRYVVQLISKPGSACADTTEKAVNVVLTELDAMMAVDIADCSLDSTNVSFFDISSFNPREEIVSWSWTIDGVLFSIEQNFGTRLATGIMYNVTLEVFTAQGCSHEITRVLDIRPLDIDPTDFDDLYVCEGDSTYLNPNFNPDYFYVWRTLDGDTFSTQPNPILYLLNDTCFLVTVASTDDLSCTYNDTLCVNFIDGQGSPDVTCEIIDIEGRTVRFDCNGPNCDVYTLYFGDSRFPDSSRIDFPYVHSYEGGVDSYCALFIPDEEALKCGLDTIDCKNDFVDPCCDYNIDWDQLICSDSIVLSFNIDTICPIDSVIWTIDGVEYRQGDIILNFENSDTPIEVEYHIYLETCGEVDSSFIWDLDTINYPLLVDYFKCEGDTVFLNPNGPEDGFVFDWRPINSVSDRFSANPFTCPSQTTEYEVTIVDPITGCSVIRRNTVSVLDFPDADVPDAITTCGDSINYCVGDLNNLSYEWSCEPDFSDLVGESNCIDIPWDGKTVIYLRLTDTTGCSEDYSIRIDDFSIDLEFDPIVVACAGDTVQICIDDLNNAVDIWQFGDDIIEDLGNGCFLVSFDEDFELNIQASNAICAVEIAILVDVFDNDFVIDVVASPVSVNKGETTQLDILSTGNPIRYIWSPSDQLEDPSDLNMRNPVGQPNATTIYIAYAEDDRGCNAWDSLTVEFTCICDEPYLYMPNAFTPNGDNLNESFNLIASSQLVQDMYLAIYNRWGEPVFETTDLSIKWDGTYNGELVNPDVYAYYLSVKCFGQDEKYTRFGNVTVLY